MVLETLKRNWLLIAIGTGVVIFLFISNNDKLGGKDAEMSPISTMEEVEKEDNRISQTIVMVDVKGEVYKPGVYEVDVDSRVNDVIQLAGGFTEDADETFVNLAQRLQDEMTIMVPKLGEAVADANGLTSDKVRVNYATQVEIETLTGIGPSKAQAIIQHRDDHGFYQSVEDLLEIPGIGEKTLENIRSDIQIP